MDNLLRQIETEEAIFFKEDQYNPDNRKLYLSVFDELRAEGIIRSNYKADKWICYSGIKMTIIDFQFNEYAYRQHIGKKLGISHITMADMLRCYCIYICGEYIFKTIQMQIVAIKSFIENYGSKALHMKDMEREGVRGFLVFIGIDLEEVGRILEGVGAIRDPISRPRELANLINYLAIDNEITDLYQGNLSDEEFIRLFPIYFWTKITFILPLRATEMLVTPFDCIRREKDIVIFRVRRTMLKKKHLQVYYDVEKDYRIFEYRLPDAPVFKNIEKYKLLTGEQKRRFLFRHSKTMTNHMLSLPAFNYMLSDFMLTNIIGNKKYDYARFASGIEEFELVTAGDSRPIAMSNLFYQDIGADICRQLADHTNINVSYGYFTNVSNTVQASSVMGLQRKINQEYRIIDGLRNRYAVRTLVPAHSFCRHPSDPLKTGDISECVIQDHLEDCHGCPHYSPSESDIQEALDKRKAVLDHASKEVLTAMVAGTKLDGADFDKVFLEAHTGLVRYKNVCDENAEMRAVKWQRHKNMMKDS